MSGLAYLIPATPLLTKQKPAFTLFVEPGHEEIYITIRDDMPKLFTADDVVQWTGATAGRVERYLNDLVKLKLLTLQGVDTQKQNIYLAMKRVSVPPVLDEDGEPSLDFELRLKLWTVARISKTFSVVHLFKAVTAAGFDVTRAKVTKYVQWMEAAGYFCSLDYGQYEAAKRDVEWCLKPAQNTGPLPPRFYSSRAAYDVNKRQMFGQAQAFQVTL